MAMSPVSTASIGSYQPTQAQENRQLLAEMIGAIQSGNLSSAQQAYTALSQNQGTSGSQSNSNSPFAQGLSQVGAALQSGDLSQAKQALSALMPKSHGAHHHHHGGSGGAQSSIATVTSTSTTGVGGSSTDPSQSATAVDLTA